MSDRSADPTAYQDVILEEARNAISMQSAALDELRSRTGFLLAAAALSASFLGSATAEAGVRIGFWGGAALIAFGLGVALCVVVLTPKRDAWTFVNSPKHLIQQWVDEAQEGKSMHLFLAKWIEENYDANEARLNDLYRWFAAAAIAIGSSVVLGCIQLATSH
jgi:hypothetical protein